MSHFRSAVVFKRLNPCLVILGSFLLYSGISAASKNIPDGAKDGAWIKSQKYLRDGKGNTATASLVSDPYFGEVLQTTIRPNGGKRSEFVCFIIGSHKHVRYEFHSKYIDGRGSLINQWHQPTGDGAGPGACVGVLSGKYAFAYFDQNKKRQGLDIMKVDNEWHTWKLDACWSFGKDGYLYLYCDGKLVFKHNGGNKKKTCSEGMGSSFKLGTYSQAKDCRMQYAWTSFERLSGPAKINETSTGLIPEPARAHAGPARTTLHADMPRVNCIGRAAASWKQRAAGVFISAAPGAGSVRNVPIPFR